MHCAEDDERAMREVARGERVETLSYFSDTLGRPPMRSEDPLGEGLRAGTTFVGSPDTLIKGIESLLEYTEGGCGAVLFRSHEWANREDTLRSYELFARWVMPRFQGSVETTIALARVVQREPHRHLRPAHRRAPQGLHRRRPGRAGAHAPQAPHRQVGGVTSRLAGGRGRAWTHRSNRSRPRASTSCARCNSRA